jgi:hypothetical protein
MRITILAVATAAATIAFSAPTMAQQPSIYPWCAQYEEGTNCGFTSLLQCQQASSGNGGFCEPNQNIFARPLVRTTTGSAPRPRASR